MIHSLESKTPFPADWPRHEAERSKGNRLKKQERAHSLLSKIGREKITPNPQK
jgi:hypothetical protein